MKKDNTFTYHWQTGLINGTTNGNWKLIGKTLILNSEKQPQISKEKFQIISENTTNSNNYELKLIDEEDEPMWFVICGLMKDTILIQDAETDTTGICKIPIMKEGNKLEFHFIGYHSIEIPTMNLKGNSLTVKMKKEDDFYRYFTNQKWIIKNDRIIDPEIKRDKFIKTNYYKKQ